MAIASRTVAIVGTVIAVLLFATVLVPVISQSSETTEPKSNSGTVLYGFGGATIAYDGTSYTVDGTAITISDRPLAIGTNYLLDKDGLKYYHDDTVDRIPTGTAAGTSWTFKLLATGSFTFTAGEQTVTGSTDMKTTLHRAIDGTYVASSGAAKVNANSEVAVYAGNGFTSTNLLYGIVQPKSTVLVPHPTPTDTDGYLPVNIALTATEEKGVYTIAGTTTTETSVLFIVPVQYMAPATASGTLYTIIGIIPLIALVGIVIGCVGYVYTRD